MIVQYACYMQFEPPKFLNAATIPEISSRFEAYFHGRELLMFFAEYN